MGEGDDKDVCENKIVSWTVNGKKKKKKRSISKLIFLNFLMWLKYVAILNKQTYELKLCLFKLAENF